MFLRASSRQPITGQRPSWYYSPAANTTLAPTGKITQPVGTELCSLSATPSNFITAWEARLSLLKIFPCICFYKNVLQISSNEAVRYKFGGCTHCRYLLKYKHKTDYSNTNNSTQYYPVFLSVCCFTDVIYSMLCKPRYTTKTKCISTDGRKHL